MTNMKSLFDLQSNSLNGTIPTQVGLEKGCDGLQPLGSSTGFDVIATRTVNTPTTSANTFTHYTDTS